MTDRPESVRTARASRTAFAIVLAVLLPMLAGCSDELMRFRGADVPLDVKPQQWWHERGPVVPHDSFPSDCSLCHVGNSWNVVRDDFEFDHLAETGVPLEGAHARAECLRCHNDRGPAGTFASRGCQGCHEDPHRSQLGTSCEDCHGAQDWQPNEQIAMHSRTRFPLVGAHAGTACFSCHEGAQVGNFAHTDTECVTCHAKDLAKAKSPDHAVQGWVSGCDECHVPTSWAGAGFRHDAFPLVGAHAATDCAACHASNNFIGTPSDCAACHQSDYDTAEPDHQAAGFPTDCDQCHNAAGWQGASFDHSSWPLTGVHAAADCQSCHVGGVYQGTPTTCVECHQSDYDGAKDPDHAGSGFPTTCDDCHGTGGWPGAFFDHTSWPLTGAHSGTDCTACHVGGVYQGTPTDCVACHQSDYDGTDDPDHAAAGFATTCDDCHATGGWAGAFFTHPMWPLTGAHSAVDCAQCHVGGVYGGTSTDCVSCHQSDYDGASDPNHVASGFPTTCEDCHSTGGWEGAFFDHASWPLTGAHSAVDCAQCHVGGVYIGTPTDCIQCHQSDYDSTSDPNHAAAGFPTDCETCHTTSTWQGAVFSHSSWPLTGAHVSTDCTQCHVGGVYGGTPTDCIACHQSDYDNTNDPDHAAAGFPVDCLACHSTSHWSGATFQHDFPITTGKHKGFDCIDCHTSPSNFVQFSCIDCHAHSQSSMASEHHNVSNYVWTSSACYMCHPKGKE
ncbi:MAG: hypothetical protein H6825_16360 [Planctomycetes bacterium]|nr:hypothetical protein [Planctomycetota bacterium]